MSIKNNPGKVKLRLEHDVVVRSQTGHFVVRLQETYTYIGNSYNCINCGQLVIKVQQGSTIDYTSEVSKIKSEMSSSTNLMRCAIPKYGMK